MTEINGARQSLAQQRILKGQCPRCGKEAAPYRLCYDHRFDGRLRRSLEKGVRTGVLHKHLGMFRINPAHTDKQQAAWSKNNTPLHMDPEKDKRARPRLRGISVDVEAMLLEIITRIGRPCTIEEIMEAWGKLRDRRHGSLPTDLSQIIAAQDKRSRKMARRAKLAGAPA